MKLEICILIEMAFCSCDSDELVISNYCIVDDINRRNANVCLSRYFDHS